MKSFEITSKGQNIRVAFKFWQLNYTLSYKVININIVNSEM